MTQPPLSTLPDGTTDHVLEQLTEVVQAASIDPLVLQLVEIRSWLQEDLRSLELETEKLLEGTAPLGPDNPDGDTPAKRAARHLLLQHGKWLRPICLLMTARIGDRVLDDNVRDLALTCELVHAATLLHDDVLDEGDTRRGVTAARLVYSNGASVLGGDHVLLQALKMAHRSSTPFVFTELLTTIDLMVSAEAHQLYHRGKMTPSREIYKTVILGKTAALFRWALLAGGSLAGLSLDDQKALARAGADLGMAFQLVDDVIDLLGPGSNTGKTSYTDLREGKLTWPVILGAEKDPSVLEEARNVAAGDMEPEILATHLRDLDVLNETRLEATRYSERALDALKGLPAGIPLQSLQNIIRAAIERGH